MPLGSTSASSGNNNRIGLLLITVILCLYTFGLIESVWHLPSPNHRQRSWLGKLGRRGGVVFGGNINLSKNGLSDVATGDADDDYVEKVHEGPVPISHWPVSIRDEDGSFEEVVHPGHKAKGHPDVLMQMPRFWINDPVSVHQNKLMSRELAMQIGSCIYPDENGNKARGDDCPVGERTIYVAIASYRDWQCRDTVTSIFSRAKFPERVRVGVVDQIVEGEDGACDAPYKPCSEDPEQHLCKYKDQLDVFQVDAQLAIGPVFARHIGHRMYRGEYYYMQSDGVYSWDCIG
jgi:hypothetical protein